MELDTERIDEAALALLYLTLHDGFRAWKGLDWGALNRLHEKGLIENPINKTKSVAFTEQGLVQAERSFKAKFTRREVKPRTVRYGNESAEATPAGGASGVLCRSIGGEYFFRVDEPGGAFTDYTLRHDDLSVTIPLDALAAFYRVGDEHMLDHSPEVLGLEPVGKSPGD